MWKRLLQGEILSSAPIRLKIDRIQSSEIIVLGTGGKESSHVWWLWWPRIVVFLGLFHIVWHPLVGKLQDNWRGDRMALTQVSHHGLHREALQSWDWQRNRRHENDQVTYQQDGEHTLQVLNWGDTSRWPRQSGQYILAIRRSFVRGLLQGETAARLAVSRALAAERIHWVLS